MLEPAHFVSSAKNRSAGDDIGSAITQVQQRIEEQQANTGDKYGGHRYQCDPISAAGQRRFDQYPLVFAEQFLHPLEGDRFTFQVSPEI